MAGADKRKQSLYLPDEMLNEMEAEAIRQDRSLSWLIQKAWNLARARIQAMPGPNDVDGADLGANGSTR